MVLRVQSHKNLLKTEGATFHLDHRNRIIPVFLMIFHKSDQSFIFISHKKSILCTQVCFEVKLELKNYDTSFGTIWTYYISDLVKMNFIICLVINHSSSCEIYFSIYFSVVKFLFPYTMQVQCIFIYFQQNESIEQNLFDQALRSNGDPGTHYFNPYATNSTSRSETTDRGCSKKSSPYICCESLRLAMEFVFQNAFFKNAIISDKFIQSCLDCHAKHTYIRHYNMHYLLIMRSLKRSNDEKQLKWFIVLVRPCIWHYRHNVTLSDFL